MARSAPERDRPADSNAKRTPRAIRRAGQRSANIGQTFELDRSGASAAHPTDWAGSDGERSMRG
jgi:hypothetical protein